MNKNTLEIEKRVRRMLRAMGRTDDEIDRWMVTPLRNTPLHNFPGETPEEVISSGRGDQLISRLLCIAIGSCGS